MTTRAEFLAHVHPPLQNPGGNPLPSSSTKSTFRVHWRELREWTSFQSDAIDYWNSLGHHDKNAILPLIGPDYWAVVRSQIQRRRLRTEPQLATPFDILYATPHNEAIFGASDDHAQLELSAPQSSLGQPDASFEINDNLVGVVEIKTFWNVTQQLIDEVLQGTAPRDTDHPGRLVVEQIYGYMVHNAIVYGVITTVNEFAFMFRENGGKLNLTRLIPATTTNPTVLQMLYYMSHLCATTELFYETHPDGRKISISKAQPDYSMAPTIPAPSIPTPRTSTEERFSGTLRRSARLQDAAATPEVDELYLYIDILAPGTYLGCKGYKGTLNTGENVFAKLWDGWKHSSKELDREVQTYKHLQPLGNMVPKMIAHGGWGFCHVLLLEFVKGKLLSKVLLNDKIEANVIAVFDTLHKLAIYHGDVRPANVIVRDDDSIVLIDFERSILNADRMMLMEEQDEVCHMLTAARTKNIAQ